MDAARKWIFNDDELKTTPNKLDGLSRGEEMNLRYNSALMIQELGEKLNLNQLCINTGIVYMHRFYTKRAFSRFHYKTMSAACLFLAAKIEDQHRKVEHVAKTVLYMIYKDNPGEKLKGVQDMMEEIYDNEQILLGTLGFETVVEHPHSLIVMTCSIIKVPKEVSHSSYLLASASLFTTMMCIQHPSTIVACACIMTAWKWAGLEMQIPEDGKEWFKRVDSSITQEKLQALSNELSTSVNMYQTKFFKKKSHKPSSRDSHGEHINRAVASSTHVNSASHASSQRRSGNSLSQVSEHQNGNIPLKVCDIKSTINVTPDETRKMKPVVKGFDHSDTSLRNTHDQNIYKPHQNELPSRVPLSHPGFTMPLPPELKPKVDKLHNMPPQHDLKKSKVDHLPWSSMSHMHSFNSTPKLESSHRLVGNYSQNSTNIESKQSVPPKLPLENSTVIASQHLDSKREDFAKEKMPKEHKKEKLKHLDDAEQKEKHKKKSKHSRDYREEYSKKVLPVKIKLPTVVSSNPAEEFKLRIKDIPKPDEKIENMPNLEPVKERLTMKIGKDMHGNFYQQTQFNFPSVHDLSNSNETISEHHSRKRKSELSSSSSSKKSRHDRRHEDGLFNTSFFPPLPPDPAPPSLPPQF